MPQTGFLFLQLITFFTYQIDLLRRGLTRKEEEHEKEKEKLNDEVRQAKNQIGSAKEVAA